MKPPFTFERKQDSSEPQADLKKRPDRDAAGDQRCSENQSIPGLSSLYFPEKVGESHVHDIADVLLDMGKLTPEQHAQLRQEQLLKPASDAETILLKMGLFSHLDG